MTAIDIPSPALEIQAERVHGPHLAGIWRKAGISLWALLGILCMAAFLMSIYQINLFFRTPYTQILEINPQYDLVELEESVKPFQEAILSLGITLDFYAHYFTLLRLLAGIPYFIVSFLILRLGSHRLMAVLFAILLCLIGAAGTIFNPLWWWIPEHFPWITALNQLFNSLVFIGGLLVLYSFPDGRFVPGWTRRILILIVPFGLAINFIPDESAFYPGNWLGMLSFVPETVFIGSGVWAMVYRYKRHAGVVQKQQIKWFTAGVLLLLLNWFVDYSVWEIYPTLSGDTLIHAGRQAVLWELFQDSSWYLAQLILIICIAISVFRYRLWDINLVINRVLVYGLLTILTMSVYLSMVGALGSLFQGMSDRVVFFLSTGFVAILFEPLRRKLQKMISRLMYGERDDPYAVLRRLSNALEHSPTPDEVLPDIAATIGQALKIPYVAIQVNENKREGVVASYGKPQEEHLTFPLIHQAEMTGSLLIARRARGEEFSTEDMRLIRTIARQAGAAAQSVKLNKELVRSRAEIVAAREEERRRLRRDLHDGLGPILASQSLKMEAARQLVRINPVQAEGILDEMIQQSSDTVAEVRRLVNGLRPPVLDELGLVEAVRDLVRRQYLDERKARDLSPKRLEIHVSGPPAGLPILPAAVEVNAYRIALEGLANVIRHSQATLCSIHFEYEKSGKIADSQQALLVQITDDGVGIPEDYQAGIGLRSMRERAEELGGSLRILPMDSRGTQIIAWLPFINGRS